LLLGCLAAPLTAGIVLLGISAFGKIGDGIWALKMSALAGYPAMIVLGLPAHLFLRKMKWTALGSYAVAGLLIGMLMAVAIFVPVVTSGFGLWPSSTGLSGSFVAILLLAAFFGLLSSATFWLFARPDRP
jgi:hypothetical protein